MGVKTQYLFSGLLITDRSLERFIYLFVGRLGSPRLDLLLSGGIGHVGVVAAGFVVRVVDHPVVLHGFLLKNRERKLGKMKGELNSIYIYSILCTYNEPTLLPPDMEKVEKRT